MATTAVTVPGQDVGSLFATTVNDIQAKMALQPKGSVGAVDIEVTFKSLQLEEKGFRFLWSREQSKESSLEIKLATRVYTSPQGEWTHTPPILNAIQNGAQPAAR